MDSGHALIFLNRCKRDVRGLMTGTNQSVLHGITLSKFCDTNFHLEVGLILENSLARFVLNRGTGIGMCTARSPP